MDTEKVEEYKKLKARAEGLNTRIGELKARQKVIREQAQAKMAELGIENVDQLKKRIAEETEKLDEETKKLITWIQETEPLLAKLEQS